MLDSRGPKTSTMPHTIAIVVLIIAIAGIVVYFLMFHTPTLEKCSNLYQSNICTSSYCATTYPCETMEWKPTVTPNVTSILGYDVAYPDENTIDSVYNTGLVILNDTYDSNVCDYMDTVDLKTYYQPGEVASDAPAGTDAIPVEDKINCIKIIQALDTEIKANAGNFLIQGKLRNARSEVSNVCSVGGTVGITDVSFIPTAEFRKGGLVSNVFC